jgi:hypothetical protein
LPFWQFEWITRFVAQILGDGIPFAVREFRFGAIRIHERSANMATTASNRMGTTDSTNEAEQHSEGVVARTIEEQTAKLPSDLFLWAAGGSILGSLALQFTGRKEESLFVGQWAPTFLILGLYNKLVKVAGSDRNDD